MTPAGLLWVAVALASILGAAWSLSSRERPFWERVLLALLPPAAIVVLGAVSQEVLQTWLRHWNDARLAPAAALARGYALYPGVDEGPLLGLIYGPMSAVMYLPAVLGRSPVVALGLGAALSMLYFFGPALAVIASEARRRGAPPVVWIACVLCFVLYALASDGLSYTAFQIHADAPALGWIAVAIAALYLHRGGRGRAAVAVSACAAVLAVLTKQVALPILVALPLLWLCFDGRRAFFQCLVAVAAASAAALGVLALCVDLEAMWLNTIVVPQGHPWRFGLWTGFVVIAAELAGLLGLALVVALAWAAWSRSEASHAGVGAREWLQEERWLVWVAAALVMGPGTVAGRLVIGGDLNALAFTQLPAAIALHLALLRASAGTQASARRFAPVGQAMLASLLLVLGLQALPRWLTLDEIASLLPHSGESAGYAIARANPGRIYFPYNPLITLMSEDKAYHFTTGVYDRVLAKLEVDGEQIRAYLPPRMEWVAIPTIHLFQIPERPDREPGPTWFLPKYRNRVPLPGAGNWRILAPEPDAP